MRIVFGTWSASGPLRPLIPLVHAAQHAGHDVLVLGDRGLIVHPELVGGPCHACRIGPRTSTS
jgi:hypothetical protein